MNLHEPELLPGSDPAMRIGRRCYKDRQGREQITDTYYGVYCLHGRERCESLKATNKELASRRALEMLLRIDRGEGHPVNTRAEIPELVRTYLEMLVGRARSPKTVEKYQHVLTMFTAWVLVNFARPAALFTEQHFWQWHGTMIEDGYSPKTRADRAIVVKQLFKWAAKVRLIPSNPLDGCGVSTPPPSIQPCFTPDQVSRIIAGADPHESAMYATIAYAGHRFGEVRELRWAMVAMPPDEPGFVTVALGGSNGTTKGRRTRRIPLHPELRQIYGKLPRMGERVFYSRVAEHASGRDREEDDGRFRVRPAAGRRPPKRPLRRRTYRTRWFCRSP